VQERKQLIQSKPAEKHFNWGSLLLGIGVAISIEGPVNTWMRTGGLVFATIVRDRLVIFASCKSCWLGGRNPDVRVFGCTLVLAGDLEC